MEKYEVQYPVAFHTVDIAIVKRDGIKTKVLLIQKVKATEAEKDRWRFPGGFVEPKHNSAEHAAVCEADEETGMKIESDLKYIGSAKIDDPRFRESPHKVITSFFEAEWKSGDAGEGPFDDAARTKWFDLDELDADNMNPIHVPLFNMLLRRYKMEVKANEIFKAMEETFEELNKNMEKTFSDVEKGFEKMVDGVKDFFKEK